jgi:hypothetical protein
MEARDECHSDNLRSKILAFGGVADIGTTGVFFRQNQLLAPSPTTAAPNFDPKTVLSRPMGIAARFTLRLYAP